MERTLRRRDATKRIIHHLQEKIENLITEEITNDLRHEIAASRTLMKEKENDLKELQEQILERVEPDQFEEELSTSTEFELKIRKLEEKIKTAFLEVETQKFKAKSIRLPKLEIKKFGGEPTEWKQFFETFETAIHKNTSITEVEKFTYLKGYLYSEAANSINGFSLTSANYEKALNLLKERYGNNKIIISSHMNKLLKVKPVVSERDVKGLRQLYDTIETETRNLESLGVESDHYGALLITIIMERIPHQIRLLINRQLEEFDNMETLFKILRKEIEARESCVNMTKQHEDKDSGKNPVYYSKGEGLVTASNLFSRTPLCVFCGESHYSDKCEVIKEYADRKDFLRKKGRCFLCLKLGHLSKNCERKKPCYYCKEISHNSAICPKRKITTRTKKNGDSPNLENIKEFENTSKTFQITRTVNKENQKQYLLQTAEVYVLNYNRTKRVKIRLLMDSGSQKTYVSERIKNLCNLKTEKKQKLSILTFGNNQSQDYYSETTKLCLTNLKGENHTEISALSVPYICSTLNDQNLNVAKKSYNHLKNLELADSGVGKFEIDVLVGTDFYWDIMTGETVRSLENEPVAMKSKFGWILSGVMQSNEPSLISTISSNFAHTLRVDFKQNDMETIEGQLHRFWDFETLGIDSQEKGTIEKVVENISINKNNRYEVSLPFKTDHPTLPTNFKSCEKQLKTLYTKLKKSPEILKAYDETIKNQLTNGIIERVNNAGEIGATHYLPHHGVIRNDKDTTKLRIVFNASSKASPDVPSLNDCLYKGPPLNPLLYEILVLFRVYPIALTTDIEKAFLQISVNENERDYMRFLWFNEIFSETPTIVHNRFARVIFGVNSSPFLLNGTLRKHAMNYLENDPKFVEKVLKSFYVDDFTSGEFDTESAFELYKKLKMRYLQGNFNLRKWRTNDTNLRNLINKEEGNPQISKGSSKPDNENKENEKKHLGLLWNEYTDTLEFKIAETLEKIENCEPTKRNSLKLLSSFYDPLGLLQPIIVSQKVLFQEICKAKTTWDEPLTGKLLEKWNQIRVNLSKQQTLVTNRCYLVYNINDPFKKFELHGFSDASLQAYGACIYLRAVSDSGQVKCSLITSKSRIAPIKSITIPRLELMGNLVLARLIATVYEILKNDYKFSCLRYWTDSTITLAWIRSTNKEYKVFVENRVQEIRKLTNFNGNWKYVVTEANPADLITRYVNPIEDFNNKELWWNGPHFLYQTDPDWPENHPNDQEQINVEEKQTQVYLTIVATCSHVIPIENYSKLTKLYRITAWILRFINNCKQTISKLTRNTSSSISAVELREAEGLWIKDNQKTFQENPLHYEQLHKQLNLFKDNDGYIRCKGRLQEASLPYNCRNPILLDKTHKLSQLIIQEAHKQVKHLGIKSTLAEVRQRFWICQGRRAVAKILHQCVICRRLQTKSYSYPAAAPLTSLRLNDSKPFETTGIDNFGPIHVKDIHSPRKTLYKTWATLYTCAASRGIILDLVPDLTSASFTQSFSRFISRRGCPNHVITDNGTNFIAEETQNYSSSHGISWHFNLPLAPWYGGFFERIIRIIKSMLRKELKNSRLTFIELQTILLEIERIVNNRPITYQYPNDLESCITPNHLLYGRRLEFISMNSSSLESKMNIDIVDYSEHVEIILNHFWERWRREYLAELRERHKFVCKGVERNHKVKQGDVVIVHEDFIPRHLWKLGVVLNEIEGRDGLVRAAEIKLGKTGSIIKRPVTKLYPIEYFRFVNENERKNEASQPTHKKKQASPHKEPALKQYPIRSRIN